MMGGRGVRVEFFKKAFQENIQPFWKLEYFFLGGGGFFREEKSASVFMYVIKILLLENKQTV